MFCVRGADVGSILIFARYEMNHYENETHIPLHHALHWQRNGRHYGADVHGRYKGCQRQRWSGIYH